MRREIEEREIERLRRSGERESQRSGEGVGERESSSSNSPVREAPKSLLSLGAMLNEYICLKEQKVMVDQERVRLEQEKCRVQTLLQGMQAVMNTYNSSGAFPSQLNISSGATRSAIINLD
ncbi:uncharacterized protein LOC133872582 [Alnus glutinosa]|uniref:uncharacterized protein LOC133872582 n=1 Tax=Alnus glutinosa TaxID=3517 RepID=UPI002D7A0C3A|nr:uncharacterized protein LOC133872582 [Alnus glutinosa]